MKYVCQVCGYVHEGDSAPEKCPQCGVPASKFTAQGEDKVWAAEHVVGVLLRLQDRRKCGRQDDFRPQAHGF